MHSYLISYCRLQMDWRTVHDESIFMGRFAIYCVYLLNRTKSSEFLEKKQLRIANPLFHFGLLCVIGGHVVGVLVPKTWTAAMGINDHMYHEGALYMGAVAGIIFIVGFLLLMKRRFTVPAMKVNTSGFDKWLYLFLTLAIFSGMAGTLLNASGFFDYRVSIGPWFRSLLSFLSLIHI